MTKFLILLGFFLLHGSRALSGEWHVAPDGASDGDGSSSRPLKLATVFSSDTPVLPGDKVWLHGGIYRGRWISHLKGTPGRPIIVSSYPGEWACLDGYSSEQNAGILRIHGSHTVYRDFEVMSSDPRRVTSALGDNPPDIVRGEGIQVYAPYTRLINLVVHDAAVGIAAWSESFNSEIYGCIIYNNGWQGPKEGGSGHGIYTQNRAGYKLIKDNVIFNQYGKGLQIYGSETAHVQNFVLEGNVVFNNGIVSSNRVMNDNVILGGGNGPSNIVMRNNYFYGNNFAGTLEIGSEGACGLIFQGNYVPQLCRIRYWQNATVTGNTFIENSTLVALYSNDFLSNTNYIWGQNSYFNSEQLKNPFEAYIDGRDGKAFTFDSWRIETGFDHYSRYDTTRPQNKVVVRANQYEKGRAMIIVYNWQEGVPVVVNLQGVLSLGQPYELRNAQNFLAGPVSTGFYDGKPVLLWDAGLSAPAPIGGTRPPPSSPEFRVYIIRAATDVNLSRQPNFGLD